MAPKTKIEQGVVIVLDVGRNVSVPDEKGGKSFFENARECAMRVIERKIISQAKNYVGILLLGSKKTKNAMAEQCPGAFRHIELYSELDAPTWNIIRELPERVSDKTGDWVDALIVAAEHFKTQCDVSITNKKIILMTNFRTPTANNPKDVQMVLDGFKDDEFEVDIIGPDLYEEGSKEIDLELARQFVEATNGATATFDFTMRYLLFHKKKAISARPWNVDLSIGPNIKIPVSCYIRIRDEPVVKSWRKAIKDPVTNTASSTEGIMKTKEHYNPENQAVVEPTEVIKGHHYGQKIIPFTECDQSMLYESGEKCLSVYGFTAASNITWQSLNGNGITYVFGRKGDKKAQQTVRCIVDCLKDLNLAGLVRRVYNKNNAPKMFALLPVIDNNDFICLSLIELCFKEDIKFMSFPSTNFKRFACSDVQVNAFKDLIKAMDLTRAYDETFDDTEAFPVAETFSPFAQYVLDCIAYRALNPGKPLPQPRDDIMNLFKMPPLVEKRSREQIEKLKSLFILNKVEKKERKKKAPVLDDDLFVKPLDVERSNGDDHNDMPKITLPVKTDIKIEHVGTIDPIGDFTKLATTEKPLSELTAEMTSAIENLIYYNLDSNFSKAFDAMLHLRKECIVKNPALYNEWLKTFKVALNDRNKKDIIEMIGEKNLSFILKVENNSSTYDSEDSHNDTQLYENDTVPNSGELTIQSEVNDLFDEF